MCVYLCMYLWENVEESVTSDKGGYKKGKCEGSQMSSASNQVTLLSNEKWAY